MLSPDIIELNVGNQFCKSPPLKLLQTWRRVLSPDVIKLSGWEHRDYKRIEAASRDELRDKLNKSNGGQI